MCINIPRPGYYHRCWCRHSFREVNWFSFCAGFKFGQGGGHCSRGSARDRLFGKPLPFCGRGRPGRRGKIGRGITGRRGFRWEQWACCADFLGSVDAVRWQEGVPRFGFVGAFCFGFGGWRRWQFGIDCELAHRFICGARRGRISDSCTWEGDWLSDSFQRRSREDGKEQIPAKIQGR